MLLIGQIGQLAIASQGRAMSLQSIKKNAQMRTRPTFIVVLNSCVKGRAIYTRSGGFTADIDARSGGLTAHMGASYINCT
jgi:hypothetical protein